MAQPAPTALTGSTRYYVQGTREVWWVPTISTLATPTLAEMNAGHDLTGEVQAMDGWSVSSDTNDVPDLANRFTAQIPGSITAPSSSITFYSSSDSVDVRSVLTRDQSGYIVIPWDGNAASNTMDIFPVTVTSLPKQPDIAAAGMIQVTFAITGVPEEDVTIPTA